MTCPGWRRPWGGFCSTLTDGIACPASWPCWPCGQSGCSSAWLSGTNQIKEKVLSGLFLMLDGFREPWQRWELWWGRHLLDHTPSPASLAGVHALSVYPHGQRTAQQRFMKTWVVNFCKECRKGETVDWNSLFIPSWLPGLGSIHYVLEQDVHRKKRLPVRGRI